MQLTYNDESFDEWSEKVIKFEMERAMRLIAKGKDKEDPKSDDKKNEDKNKENQPPRQNQLSPEQMKQLLEAMNNEENKTQQKLNEQKAKGRKIKQEKDW